MQGGPATGLGSDPAYESPGDARTLLRNLKLMSFSLVAVAVAAAIPLSVPGLWGELFLLLWVATLAGALWGGWQAGSAVLLLLAGTLFNLPLILGEGGARYVVWEVGSRALSAALAAWMAAWLLRRRRRDRLRSDGAPPHALARSALVLLVSTLTATLIVVWLHRGDQLQQLPVTALGLAIASIPAALALRALAGPWSPIPRRDP